MYMYILYLLYMYIWIRGGYPGTIGFNANKRCGIHLRKLPLFHTSFKWETNVAIRCNWVIFPLPYLISG